MQQDQEFLEFIVKAIVGNPDEVKVTRTVDERGVLLSLDVSANDIGYVIGRRGQTAQSIRTLLRIVGAKNNARVNLKINEPVGGKRDMAAQQVAAAANNSEVDTSAVDNLDI